MGREVRRVVPGWDHPKDAEGHYKPLYDADFETTARQWLTDAQAWDHGTHPAATPECKRAHPFFWQWDGDPPDAEYYRPKWQDADRTWVQVYETVSEGTPVTPAFATAAELVDYLVQHGDFWDQKRGRGGWQREHAESFVARGWAMSGMLVVCGKHAGFYSPRDGMPPLEAAPPPETQE